MKGRLDWRLVAVAAAVIIVAFCSWHWPQWRQKAAVATGFGARVACSCRQVEGRPIGSCRSDFARQRGMELVQISDRADGKGVDATVPFLARRSARLVPGFGCVMDDR